MRLKSSLSNVSILSCLFWLRLLLLAKPLALRLVNKTDNSSRFVIILALRSSTLGRVGGGETVVGSAGLIVSRGGDLLVALGSSVVESRRAGGGGGGVGSFLLFNVCIPGRKFI